jgi:hypothetical protein
MYFNGSNNFDVQRAQERFKWLVRNKKVFELKEKKTGRSLSQNSYLHLILSWYALEYGETLEYVKQEIFKKDVNKSIFEFVFINRKTGEERTEYKSTADLNTAEMTMAIDRFRDFAVKQSGFYLPQPSDLAMMQQLEIEVANNQHYL